MQKTIARIYWFPMALVYIVEYMGALYIIRLNTQSQY